MKRCRHESTSHLASRSQDHVDVSPYCLITPDAVLDGRVGEIVSVFTSERLGILSLEYATIDAALMLRLYGGESYAIPSQQGAARVASSAVDRVFD